MTNMRISSKWVRERLHFCVIPILNNAYYQVREAETQAFYELFRVELESRNLEELLRRFLESLVHVCRADAGRLYMLNGATKTWELRAGSPKTAALGVPNRPGLVKKLSKPRHLNGDAHSSGVLLAGALQVQPFRELLVDLRLAGQWPYRRLVMQFGFAKPPWLSGCLASRNCWPAAAERCPDGRGKGRRGMEIWRARGTGAAACRAYAARRRDGTPPHQPRASRRSRPKPCYGSVFGIELH